MSSPVTSAGSYSLMKKRLRLSRFRHDFLLGHYAGSYSLMKKRLRRNSTAERIREHIGRKLFADEEAIETDYPPMTCGACGIAPEAIR